MKKILSSLIAGMLITGIAYAQQPRQDKIEIRPYKPGYYDNDIMKGVEQYQKEEKPEVKKPIYKIDVSMLPYYPKSVSEFTSWWKNRPISQGNTGTCWSYSSTSYFETEVYRLTKQEVKISEMYTAYWEYVEKARRYVRERGNSNFDEGSEGNGTIRIYKTYGCVPLESYSGLLPGQKFHAHNKMVAEMRAYLQTVKAANAWNEEMVLETIKSILNHYMTAPPVAVNVNGKTISPKQYLSDVLKLNMDDYVDVVSLKVKPYWTKMEYEVPDNWWHDSSYYNVPLDVFMSITNNAIRKGYTIMIGGDVSEAGFDAWNQLAVVPTFDIPSAYINEDSRTFRFVNGTTTDDHGMHLVGYLEKNGSNWYLVKDSGAGSRNCGKESENFGFYFMHEDFLKLKMMDLLLHKDMIKDYLNKFKS
jgi:bleomycin hydrolase